MADVITRLKLESGEYDSKIKRATQGLLQMEQECRKVGGTLAVLEKDQKQYVQSLGQMQTVSNTARGKLGELKQAFVELSAQYKRLTDEEKKGDFGRALKQSLDDLKPRIATAKKDLSDIDKELNGIGRNSGQFGGMLDSIGSKLGINGNLTEMLTSKTALMTAGIAAAGAAAYKAAEAFASYNSELAKQDQITTVTTGLQGADADKMSDAAAAISKVYGADFREVINAANTLMTQFGESGDNAMQLIRDGMQGMISGDGGKLLSMIQQYAPSFRDAGISASQLVAIIQNSEGGIFTDQNMNAIVMGIKNIRLMTDATSEALAKLGINGEEMSRKLNDGSMTIFEALKQVADAIENTNSGSQAAGEVMQQVFGRQGAMAGTKLGEAIATLNTNLEETKKQTGEVGESFARLEQATEKFNNQLRETFGYKGWEEMTNEMKSSFYEYATDTMKGLDKIKQGIKDTADFFHDDLGGIPSAILGPISTSIYGICEAFDQMEKAGVDTSDTVRMSLLSLLGPIGMVVDSLRNLGRQTPADILNGSINSVIYTANKARLSAMWQSMNPMRMFHTQSTSSYTPTTAPKGGSRGGRGGGGSTKLTPAQQAEANMAKAAETYTNALADAEQKVIVGLMTEEDLQKTKLKLLEQIADANLNAWHLSDNDKYLTSFVNFANAAVNLRDNLMSVDDVFKQLEKDFPNVMTTSGGEEGLSFAESFASAAAADKGFGHEADVSKFVQDMFKAGLENGVDMSEEANIIMERLFEGMDVPDVLLQGFADELNAKLAELGIEPIKINIDTKTVEKEAKIVDKSWQNAAQAIGQVSSALGQIESPAAKIIGTIGQAIATIALGYAQATTQAAQQGGPWAWIAFAATGLATMVSMISCIHSATGYAQGGIIKGNSYSGDNIGGLVDGSQLVGLNAGEVVLSHAQTETLANSLENDQQGGITSLPYVMGEQIILGANAFLRRSGRGELVTTKMR